MFLAALTNQGTSEALAAGLPPIATAAGCDYFAVWQAADGAWQPIVHVGPARIPPATLLADVLDADAARSDGPWVSAPLVLGSGQRWVVAGYCPNASATGSALGLLRDAGQSLALALAAVRGHAASRERIARLERILALVTQWNRTPQIEPLLTAIARAATELLACDRASIFLWDRGRRTLVGRPALGVPEGELRIPDDRGVVGEVLRTGRAMRVDAATEPHLVDRRVDSRTGYRTQTLLAVPLRGASRELFGVFELINKRSGRFTVDDERAAAELAEAAAAVLENAQDRQQLLASQQRLMTEAADRVQLVGRSPAIEALRSIVGRVAETELAVLVLGENGTGKEVVAQSIHYLSRRRDKPFVAVNCAAIPDTLAESELFGHEKGAFTDAREARQGKFELASGGTLLLDEIGELSLACQAKLLRVLEEKVLVRVGGSRTIHTDARVVAATNQDLAAMVGQKRFREDLYYRLNVVTLEIPPLRERAEDVMLLAEHFLADFCRKARRPVPEFTLAARERLSRHPWPGNVRELRNLMERLAYLSRHDRIDADELAFILSPRVEAAGGGDGATLADATAQFQADLIRRAVRRAGGNMAAAAAELGLHRSNLYRKMRQLGMETD